MKFNLRTELKKLQLGIEELREDLWSPTANESESINASNLANFEQGKINALVKEAEKQENELGTLEDVLIATESHTLSGLTLTRVEEAALRLMLLQTKTYRLNHQANFLATEAFGDGNFIILATEDLKEKIKQTGKNVTSKVKEIWETVLKFLKSLFTNDKKLLAKTQHLLKTVESIEMKTDVVLTSKNYFGDLAVDNEIDVGALNGTLARLSRLYDAHTNALSMIVQQSGNMNDEDFNSKVLSVIASMCKSIIEDADDKSDGIATTKLNDAWTFGVRREGVVTIPFIEHKTIKAPENVNCISKEDAIKVLKNITKILGFNTDEDFRTANDIVQKLKADQRIFKELNREISVVGRFVIKRASVRHSICNDMLNFIGMCVSESSKSE